MNAIAHLHDKGRPQTSIEAIFNQLKHLARYSDLQNPKAIEKFIADKQRANGYKQKLCNAYKIFCDYYRIEWELPHYQRDTKMFRLPTEEQINKLIASAGKILSLKLWLMKETGLRPIEIHNLTVKNLDTEHATIGGFVTAKRGAPRTLKISTNLVKALQTYIIKNDRNLNDKIFKSDSRKFGNDFRGMRKKVAQRTQDPEIMAVRLYDFRHYFGTMAYWKYRDVATTAQDLGHKSWNTTMTYVHMTRIIELQAKDGWICKTAQNVDESKALIEAGFDYVTDQDGIRLYRKRK